VSRHQRLQKTLRNPQRKARQWRNREGRFIRRKIREHFADGHVHPDGTMRCPRDIEPEVKS
jgi:hypothetical protein